MIEKIIEVDQNPDLYLEMLSQPYFPNNELNKYVKEGNILKQLDFIVGSLENAEPVAKKYKPNPVWIDDVKRRMMYAKRNLSYYLHQTGL